METCNVNSTIKFDVINIIFHGLFTHLIEFIFQVMNGEYNARFMRRFGRSLIDLINLSKMIPSFVRWGVQNMQFHLDHATQSVRLRIKFNFLQPHFYANSFKVLNARRITISIPFQNRLNVEKGFCSLMLLVAPIETYFGSFEYFHFISFRFWTFLSVHFPLFEMVQNSTESSLREIIGIFVR